MRELFGKMYSDRFGVIPEVIEPLAGDGSSRRYFRVQSPSLPSAIGVLGPDREENRAFLSFTESFRSIGLPVPEIYGVNASAGAYLEEDLGDVTLFRALVAARESEKEAFPLSIVPVYKKILEILPRFQVLGGQVVNYEDAYPHAAFDRESISWDLNYFKYHFLQLGGVRFHESRLERDFRKLSDFLLEADTSHFLYRDFQSRNIMLRGGNPWFIDYQGGRRGALQYDVASLLYDAKAAVPQENRDHLLEHYLDGLSEFVPVDRIHFRELYRGYVIVRILQAMGAYGRRGFYERKAHFLQSVPYAIGNIERLLNNDGLPIRLPELEAVFERMIEMPSLRKAPEAPASLTGLTVSIQSFSYRNGIPQDSMGHGGGFVFDCRALPNPGRLIDYMPLTGRDPSVVEYLETRPEVEAFWSYVRGMIDLQVQNYLDREFKSLTVFFGCTGGQHRSVYLAERLMSYLKCRYPEVQVNLLHRESPSWPISKDLVAVTS